MNPHRALEELPEALQALVRELHHVAIAVPSIAEGRKLWQDVLGLEPVGEIEYVPSQKVNVLVLYGGGQRVELVEPASPVSPITRFVESRGGGIHHLAWRVDDVAAAIAKLKSHGVNMIDEIPQPGSHGTTVAFVHPKATYGVLMELVEDPD